MRYERAPAAAASLAAVLGTTVLAGGTPENALIVIDPSSAESMYVGNYYRAARQIPESNVMYLDPDAASYAEFAADRVDALFGVLANRVLNDHIDYIVVTTGNGFFVSAPGYVTDNCFPVSRFSHSTVWTMSFIRDEILAGGHQQNFPNRYYSASNTSPQGFDSEFTWFGGSQNGSDSARRYFLGTTLGYTGFQGNTVAEILAMIDRSVAVDGTRPAGTFYFMNNTADSLRNVRQGQFNTIVSAINSAGGSALKINNAALPLGMHDCLGVMTGFASAGVTGADMTLRPGSFCDHLTSYAAAYDIQDQTKTTSWIRKGASGSAGTVEEPCNYTGKFPHARFHLFYYQGLSMGESYLRSALYMPFQGLFVGDPLTRPFTYIPSVSVSGFPSGPVGGVITFTPSATTARPSTMIARLDLLIDGVLASSVTPGNDFSINTALLADGTHDVRVLAVDNSTLRSVGRWIGSLTVDNDGLSASVTPSATSGNLTQMYTFTLGASGGTPAELRLIQNGRVVAARTSEGNVSMSGYNLGAGQSRVQCDAVFSDGSRARSATTTMNISYATGTSSGAAPIAHSYTVRVRRDADALIELPASFDRDPSTAAFTLVTPPSQATVAPVTKGYVLIRPVGTPCGADALVFRVTTVDGASNDATVTIQYTLPPRPCPADFNNDGFLSGDDFDEFSAAFELGDPSADFNNDCFPSGDDFDQYVSAFEEGC